MPGRKNPMCNTFPRIASCDYWRWGSGGRQENINAICILGLNHINDKVYLNSWKKLFLYPCINIPICRCSCCSGGGASLLHLLLSADFYGELFNAGDIVFISNLLQNITICRSAWLRFQLLNLRMNRYFRRSTKMEKIRAFIVECKLGDWFVLYQMSKNLNRPFFMDFLTCLSVRYSIRGNDDDTDSDTG